MMTYCFIQNQMTTPLIGMCDGVLVQYDPLNTIKKYKLIDENGPYRLCAEVLKEVQSI